MPRPPSAPLAPAVRLLQAGRFGEAAKILEHHVRNRPADAQGLLYLGLALRKLGRDAEALAAFDRAIATRSPLAEAHHQRGNVLKRLGQLQEAIGSLRTATKLAPRNAVCWLNLGAACLDAGFASDAVAALRQAITLEPQRAEGQNILGVALQSAGEFAAARAAFEEALRLRPELAGAWNNLARLDKAEGRLQDAVAHFRKAIAVTPNPTDHSNLLLALNYLADLPPEESLAEHRCWNALHAEPFTSAARRTTPSYTPSRRLRIGYLSPDFGYHAVACFIGPILAAHDRDRVEVFCYANVAAPDAGTARLQALAEHWRDISQLDDEAAATQVRADGIDLLIDLAGHTAHHRLLVLARRPAPVQATWIGYPNTTGLRAIDYRITDPITDPPGQTDALHVEKLVRLPTGFLCYAPDPSAPPVNPPPGAAAPITFGCFNNFAKVTPHVIRVWADILRRLPESKLYLKSRGLSDRAVADRIRAEFAAAGVSADRVQCNGTELPVAEHLSLYHGIDIGLDPFPYNGTTTTCEALWMGVPVLTLAGRVHAGRVGASLLSQLGLEEWIATSVDDYIARAVSAGQDPARLAVLRSTLRERMRTSPLCDAPGFTRRFEAACEEMATLRA